LVTALQDKQIANAFLDVTTPEKEHHNGSKK